MIYRCDRQVAARGRDTVSLVSVSVMVRLFLADVVDPSRAASSVVPEQPVGILHYHEFVERSESVTISRTFNGVTVGPMFSIGVFHEGDRRSPTGHADIESWSPSEDIIIRLGVFTYEMLHDVRQELHAADVAVSNLIATRWRRCRAGASRPRSRARSRSRSRSRCSRSRRPLSGAERCCVSIINHNLQLTNHSRLNRKTKTEKNGSLFCQR